MLDIQITGLDEARKLVRSIGDRAGNITPAANPVFAAVQEDVARRIGSAPGVRATTEVYGGVTWERLSERYILAAKREGGTQLRITGDLERQFQKGQSGNVAEAAGDTIEFGADSPKAAGLHKRRPIIVAHPELILEVSQILAGYVSEGKV